MLRDLKSVGSRRVLYLSEPLVVQLERHRDRQEAERRAVRARWHDEERLVFRNAGGGPVDVDNFGQSVPRICKAAGLGHWSIHELRHSCASLLLAQDVPLEVVSEQLGHSSIRVTKDVSGHLLPSSKIRAAGYKIGYKRPGRRPARRFDQRVGAPRGI